MNAKLESDNHKIIFDNVNKLKEICNLGDHGEECFGDLHDAVRVFLDELSTDISRYYGCIFFIDMCNMSMISSAHEHVFREDVTKDDDYYQYLNRNLSYFVYTIAWEGQYVRGQSSAESNTLFLKKFERVVSSLQGNKIYEELFRQQADLPHQIVKMHFLSTPANIQNTLKEMQDRIEEKKKEFQNEMNQWDQKISIIKNNAGAARKELNFVGLSKAYQDLLRAKNIELLKSLIYCGVFFILMISLLLYEISTIGAHMDGAAYVKSAVMNWQGWSEIVIRILLMVPAFLLFLYMFRIGFRNYQSVRGQIVQLQIRQATCQFVEAYSEFVANQVKMTADTGDHLRKFESLIFAGLSPDPDSVPSTFDGFEQIVEAFKAIRVGGNK